MNIRIVSILRGLAAVKYHRLSSTSMGTVQRGVRCTSALTLLLSELRCTLNLMGNYIYFLFPGDLMESWKSS